ncbi:MAG: hypothetical protein KJ674_04915 [Nanoarchaeota archaeon]|nr:hypothetical protein [Nanoarchaeota archaeon]
MDNETYKCEEDLYSLRVNPAALRDSLLGLHNSMREDYTPGKDGPLLNGLYVSEPIGIMNVESRQNLDSWLSMRPINSLSGKIIYISLPHEGNLSPDKELGKIVVSEDQNFVDVHIFGKNSFLFNPQDILDRLNKMSIETN